ncbi:hypothetical protein HMPREF9440_00881 [Sutterella parvirubra YIT 11816]|uniref:Uncharacterized protein n=1 Tax=Sutterella parvirubra YIT 11816 TaxID=762967 RepID=H3KDS0_9BURK|nr:hypothetical protein HMPREF9440_00881 [Sutterella parvirubra YIT 11816]
MSSRYPRSGRLWAALGLFDGIWRVFLAETGRMSKVLGHLL